MHSTHLDEEQVERLLHGELASAAETSTREHLARCPGCRERVAEAERDEERVHALLRQLDHPPPRVDADVLVASARAHGSGWARWAAGILLALGMAGAAYATPGSPLPAWVERVVGWIGGRSTPSSVAPVPGQGAEDQRVAGIAVVPGRNLVIQFTSPQAEGHARVSLTDGTEVMVRGPVGAATFTTDLDRLVIDNSGSSATFEIQIPRAAPRVEIRLGGDRVFLKDGPRVTTDTPADTAGPYRLPLTPSRP